MFQPLNRRQFVKVGALGIGSVYAMRQMPSLFAQSDEEPHFFLQIYMPGGLDVTYTFDARPLSMTTDNLQHNVLGEEQLVYEGKNGGRCLRSPLTKVFDAYLSDFSVINGIHMTVFDGHEQNASYLMTGNAFGGEGFIPFMNAKATFPLDYVRLGNGNFFVQQTNDAKSVQLSAEASRFLSKRISELGRISETKNPLKQGVANAKRLNEEGLGGFAASAGMMADGLLGMPQAASAFSDFWSKTKNVAVTAPDFDVQLAANLMSSLFVKKITRSAIFVFDTDLNPNITLDVHDGGNAAKLPATVTALFSKIKKILDTFKQIPFDGQRSLYDLTTFMVTSEFGRTRRSYLEDVNKGGTDHNQFVNTVLLGGKGVNPGLVLGGSDLQSSEEIKEKKVSSAHMEMDPQLFRIMGKPFDFKTYKNFEQLKEPYKPKNYLSMPSVVNTAMKIMGVEKEKFLLTERNGDVAPLLKPLIA